MSQKSENIFSRSLVMKKKLLFVIPSLRIGGAEKSYVNLLTELDYTKYDVRCTVAYYQLGNLSAYCLRR